MLSDPLAQSKLRPSSNAHSAGRQCIVLNLRYNILAVTGLGYQYNSSNFLAPRSSRVLIAGQGRSSMRTLRCPADSCRA